MSDQASHLRRMVGGRESPPPALRMAQASGATAVAVTSGKGGVGKSNLSVNLALALGRSGERVALVDADLGLANADVLCGVQPLATLEQCLSLRRPLLECAVSVPGGFTLVPGASGVARLADLEPHDRAWLLDEIGTVAASVDWMIVDTGAGIGENTVAFAAAADRVLVVTTPEPPSMADAYGMIKTLSPRVPAGTIELVVNQARDDDDARAVWLRLDRVSRAFLSRELPLAGWIPFDASLPQAVRGRVPLLTQSPSSAAARGIVRIAQRLQGAGSGAVGHSDLAGACGHAVIAAGGAPSRPTRSGRVSGATEVGPGGFLGRLSRLFLGPGEARAVR